MTEIQWRVTIIKANNPDVNWDHPVKNSKKKHKGKQRDTSDHNEENNDEQQSSLEVRLPQFFIQKPLQDETGPDPPPLLEMSVGKDFTSPPQASSSPEVISSMIMAPSSTPSAPSGQVQGLQRERPSTQSSNKVSSPRREPPARRARIEMGRPARLPIRSDPLPVMMTPKLRSSQNRRAECLDRIWYLVIPTMHTRL
jgi:hypothetical protein